MAICRASRGSSQRGGGLSLLDGSVAGVASGLRVFCRLRHASDLCRRNSCTPPSIAQRPHAFARRVTGRRARRKLSRTAHGARATGRFDMRGSRLELAHAIDLSVHAFQRGGEHLLAPQGVLGCARKARASLRPFSAHRTAIFARQGALLIAHPAQTLTQRLEVIKRGVIDFRMVTAQDDLMLVVAENAALEFAGYGHGGPPRVRSTAQNRSSITYKIAYQSDTGNPRSSARIGAEA